VFIVVDGGTRKRGKENLDLPLNLSSLLRENWNWKGEK